MVSSRRSLSPFRSIGHTVSRVQQWVHGFVGPIGVFAFYVLILTPSTSLGSQQTIRQISSNTSAQSVQQNLARSSSQAGEQLSPTDNLASLLAALDSLYDARQFLALRDTLRTLSGTSPNLETPEILFYRGVVAYAFNQPETAIGSLRSLLDRPPVSFPIRMIRDAIDALGMSYGMVSQYSTAADLYRSAIQRWGPRFDTSARNRFNQMGRVMSALRQTAPLRVRWTAEARYDTLPNGGIPGQFQATINTNDADQGGIAFFTADPSLSFTMLDSAVAARYDVTLLGPRISVSLASGGSVSARVGVVSLLYIGPAVITNVPVLVVPDMSLISGDRPGSAELTDSAPVRSFGGTLGLPTLLALGNMTFFRDGHLAVTSPGVVSGRPDTLPSGARMAMLAPIFFDGGTPMIAQESNGDGISGPLADMFDSQEFRDADAVTLDLVGMTLQLRKKPPPPIAVLPSLNPTDAAGSESASRIPPDLAFVALLFALFVVPKALQRYRIPSAITSLIMGASASALGLFHDDPTLNLLSTFGIVALFLFAGLEIDGRELRKHAVALIQHNTLWLVLAAVVTWAATWALDSSMRVGALIALALLTPSTGFILSSLAGFGLKTNEQFAVKTYAIGSELLALAGLFIVLQSTSVEQFFFSLAAMIGVVVVIPIAFRLFATVVAPHAPRSEFAFLLMTAVVCAYATRRLGVYYLVGAFLVGVAAQRFRSYLPAMSSEKMVDALESFGSVFVPFYFFRAGTHIVAGQLTPKAIGFGILLILVCVPLRIGAVLLHRRFILKDDQHTARRVGIALVPTLVFTLVLVEILQSQFGLSDLIAGGLVLYTVVNTTIPAFALRSAPPEFEHVTAAPMELEELPKGA